MFSSLASLLPSALHINTNADLPKHTVDPEETYHEDEENAYVRTVQPQPTPDRDQQSPTKEKGKDVKSPSETFIFVRPPPSKTNHPLNLQVQLVPPYTRPPGGVIAPAGDATPTPTSADSANTNFTTEGVPLARTSSSRSSVSYTSAYGSSTTSFSSFSSTSNGSTGHRRTIIPLYNLQAHNVMTNVIVDAGTDAKIAKFQKRGIELIDLALLEPVEVWGEGGKEKDARRESMRIVADEMGASVVNSVIVNADGRRGSLLSAKLTTFLQPGGSRPATPSAASSATSLHSQLALANRNADSSTIQAPIPQHLSSHITVPVTAPVTAPPTSISHSNSNSSSSDNPTPVPPASPAPVPPTSLALMSPPASPASGTASGKRNLFNKLFNKKQSSSNLLSPSGSGPPGLSAEGLPPPTFSSLSLGPDTAKSFGGRSNSMKRRSAPPPTLLELPTFSPPASAFGFASPGLGVGGISDVTSPTEQRTPTQMSIAGGMKTIITVTSPTPSVEAPREREKGHGRNMSLTSITSPFKASLKSRLSSVVLMGHGGSQSSSQAHDSGSNGDDSPTTVNKKQRDSDRDASPHPSLGSRSRLSINDSADSHGGNWSFGLGGNGGGNGHAPQLQPDITTNLRQQQLQLRPPVLGIQPTFVSSNPSSSASSNPNAFTSDVHTQTTTENPEQVLQGQRALIYVWLVRRWMKKRLSSHSGLGDSAVGFLSGVGGLKGEKEKGKEKEKAKDKDKRRNNSADCRDKKGTGSSHDGSGAVTAPLMYGGVEVRFEWKRAKVGKERGGSGKKKNRGGRGRTGTVGGAESDGEVEASIRDRTRESERERERDDRDERGSIRGSGEGPMMAKTKERLKSEEKRKFRMSTGSISSIATNSEIDGLDMKKKSSTGANNQYDDGEDSDPEDSETPWICTLKLRRGAAPVSGGGSLTPMAGDAQTQPPILQTQVLRIKVGTLSPTPHHPKVVAMLKVPFPLPDVEVERMGVVKRGGIDIPTQKPTANQDTTPYNGLMLTAEEIKDIVCSTGLWLVVREGFGGVGKVRRKGNGWRIRA